MSTPLTVHPAKTEQNADAAIAQVAETAVSATTAATAAATDMAHRTTDAFAPVLKSAQAHVAELTGTIAAEMQQAETKTQEIMRTFAEEMKNAEAKTKALTAVYVEEFTKAQKMALDWSAALPMQWAQMTSRSLHSCQVAVERSLNASISFADAMNVDWISDMTRRNAKAMTGMMDSTVAQVGGMLK